VKRVGVGIVGVEFKAVQVAVATPLELRGSYGSCLDGLPGDTPGRAIWSANPASS